MPRKKTHEEFVKEVYDLVGDEYSILGTYKNNKTKIEMRHNKCGYEYPVTPSDFLQGKRCPKCANFKRNEGKLKSPEQFKKEFYNLVGDEYKLLSEYKNSRTPIFIKHNKCGHEYSVCTINFLSGQRCPKCFGSPRKTTEQFKKDVFNLVGNEYIVLGKYINNKIMIKMKHNKCGYEYLVQPNKFLYGRRCPRCWESKGEKKIADYLDKLGIKYKAQQTFKDLKDINLLKYDFRIYTKDENYFLLLEYDGIQHFEPSFGEESFKMTKKHDEIKDKYIISHDNMCLYRIDYTEFDKIEECIDEIITEYKNEIIYG